MGIRLGTKAVRHAASSLAVVSLIDTAIFAVAPAAQAAVGADVPEELRDFEPGKWDASAGPESAESAGAAQDWPEGPEPGSPPAEDEVAFPDADTWDVTLQAPGKAAKEAGRKSGNPVKVVTPAANVPGLDATKVKGAEGKKLKMKILDRAAAKRVGAAGFVFTVEGSGGGTAPDVPVGLEIDYSDFAQAFGGDFAQRLQVVALPGCVLEEPRPADCQATPRPVEAKNLGDEERLVVEIPDLDELAAPVAASSADRARMASIRQSLADASKKLADDAAAEAKALKGQKQPDVPDELGPWASSGSASNPATETVADVAASPPAEEAAAAGER